VQWTLLVQGFIQTLWSAGKIQAVGGIQIDLDVISLINADFAAGAVLISMGGVLGKLTHAQMLFMVFVEIIV